jgi:hypothetical protein
VFQVTTFGLSATAGTQIGELWATYDVEFLKPQLPDPHIGTTSHINFTSNTALAASTSWAWNSTVSTPAFTANVVGTSSLPVKSVPTTYLGRLVMPKGYGGNYLLTWVAVGTGGNQLTQSVPNIGSVAGSGITGLNLLPSTSSTDGTSFVGTYATNAAAAALVYTFSYDGSGTGEMNVAPSLANGGAAANTIYGSITIAPLDNDVITLADTIRKTLKRQFGCLPDSVTSALARLALCDSASSASAASVAPPPSPKGRKDSTAEWEEEKGIHEGDVLDRIDGVHSNDLSSSIHVPREVFARLMSGK